MDVGRRLAVTEPGGWSFEPTLEDTLDRSIHQILSIIHSLNVITAAAQPGRRISVTAPTAQQEAKTQTTTTLFSPRQLLDLVTQQRMEIEVVHRQS